jgi:hypothetical protein
MDKSFYRVKNYFHQKHLNDSKLFYYSFLNVKQPQASRPKLIEVNSTLPSDLRENNLISSFEYLNYDANHPPSKLEKSMQKELGEHALM